MMKLSLLVSLGFLSVNVAAVDMVNALPRVRVVQGDMARFTAQFGGGNSVSVSFVTQDVGGRELGRVAVDAASGGLVWSIDSGGVAPGQHLVELVRINDGSVSDRKQLILDVVEATKKQKWNQIYFGNSEPGVVAADDSDPDHDGISNIVEFALGLNPMRGGEAVAVAQRDNSGEIEGFVGMRAEFRRRKDHEALGIAYQIEFSSDLTDWTVSEDSPALLGEDGMIEQVGLAFPVLSNGRQARFFRVKVQQNSVPPAP